MLFLLICFVGFLEYTTVTAAPTLAEVNSKTADFRSTINKEYKVQYYVKANWYNAYLFCRDNGMQLATITSQEEQDYVEGLIKDFGVESNYWISGASVAEEDRFSWFSNGRLFKYANWAPNQPDNMDNNEHCVHLYNNNNYKWNDANCNILQSFICERDLIQ